MNLTALIEKETSFSGLCQTSSSYSLIDIRIYFLKQLIVFLKCLVDTNLKFQQMYTQFIDKFVANM